ncbi:MAG: hypothetical protein IIC46_08845 [Planctomycetes bacterium]|nr:hypothetical protein [Planctomycetota bacterium]
MVLPVRAVLVGVAVISAAAGGALWLGRGPGVVVWILLLCGVIGLIVARMGTRGGTTRLEEPDDVSQLSTERRHQLVRGTSMHLRDMRYRYSVRAEHHELGGRECFNAEVNNIHLGFVPVMITDNATDKQGYGFVAFVYDGRRWRGPGLPCPGGRERALQHAQHCVSPLDESDEPTS